MQVKAMDWDRHNRHIYNKVIDSFAVIGKELASPVVLAENTYSVDEAGILSSVLNSLKVLAGRHELKTHRGACVERTLITSIECINRVYLCR
jgi:hypothetical protein